MPPASTWLQLTMASGPAHASKAGEGLLGALATAEGTCEADVLTEQGPHLLDVVALPRIKVGCRHARR
jgi:hypothetical protein